MSPSRELLTKSTWEQRTKLEVRSLRKCPANAKPDNRVLAFQNAVKPSSQNVRIDLGKFEEMTPFRWANCNADVRTFKHGMTIRAYLDDVIVHSIDTLEQRIRELEASDDPIDMFTRSDTLDVLRETKIAFALSVQSIWERQLRTYLAGCARELRPDDNLQCKVEEASWDKLQKMFRQLRGLGLDCFPSFPLLDTLQHLGNACRHGDGNSATRLQQTCPDFWKPLPSILGSFEATVGVRRLVSSMDISSEQLRQFAEAIAQFWDDTKYKYNESIEKKHPSLEAELVIERQKRHWLPDSC
jgi:hypothetical protein